MLRINLKFLIYRNGYMKQQLINKLTGKATVIGFSHKKNSDYMRESSTVGFMNEMQAYDPIVKYYTALFDFSVFGDAWSICRVSQENSINA